MISIEEIIDIKKEHLEIYTALNFIPKLDKKKLVEETLIKPILSDFRKNLVNITNIIINEKEHIFIVRYLEWDTKYFGFPIYKIELILYNHNELSILNNAIKRFTDIYIDKEAYYFINIPCEDILLVQAICSTKFILIETRLNLYLSNIQNYEATRYPVKVATLECLEQIKRVAIKMKNNFDRVHADPAFTSSIADEYLGKFAEESIKGFADIVLIPDVLGLKPFGFLAGNNPQNILGVNISKLVLAAVDNSIKGGWLFRLLSEMIYKVKEAKAEYLTTITQSANRTAIHVWGKAGFKLGNTTHIFSYKSK